ncbi:InlB B-repeat-containing protein [Cerasicoccus frondis]|uniref:InlB B-repeat-containing protein n=1 Tax=Cerasicoccus frondis TaxID=490090 RepID=UPI0028527F21|nr:InlB B-repeat-containing protein [Cerasicoccus frondis]
MNRILTHLLHGFSIWLVLAGVTAQLQAETIFSEDISTCTVTFQLGDYGTLLSGELSQTIIEGGSAIAPEISVDDGWGFAGWDTEFSDVMQDITVTASYLAEDWAGILETNLTSSEADRREYFGSSVSMSGHTVIIGAPGDQDRGANTGSAYIYIQNNGAWTEQTKLTASDPAADSEYGSSVGISGDTVVIGAHGKYDETGAAYIYTRNNGVWTEQAKLIASDAAVEDNFGSSVSISGDTIVIGSKYDDDAGISSGSAYVFTRIDGEWLEQTKLIASDAAANDRFGFRVSISGDTAVVGTYDSGSAYVFTRTDGVWSEQAKITASDAPVRLFGDDLSISGDSIIIGADAKAYIYTRTDGLWTEQALITNTEAGSAQDFGKTVSINGDIAIIGADQSSESGSYSGSAYVYIRKEGVWTEKTKLTASDADEGDSFGCSVNVSGDTVAIGATGDDKGGTSSGSAYIYDLAVPPLTVTFSLEDKGQRTGGGELSQLVVYQQAAIEPTVEAAEGWYFNGWNQNFSEVTKNLSIKANYLPLHTVNFDLGEYGTLTSGELSQEIPNGFPATAPNFSVADNWAFIGWDTEFLAVESDLIVTAQYVQMHTVTFDLGAHGSLIAGTLDQAIPEGGSAIPPEISVADGWAFVGWNTEYSNISQDSTITAMYSKLDLISFLESKLYAGDGAADDYFGYSVSISGDTAIVGAYQDDDGGNRSGSAYIYVQSQGEWSEQAKLTASDAAANDYFGYSVSISGDTAIIGAYQDDDEGKNSGSVYVYTRNNDVWSLQTKLTASDAAADDYFGCSVSISGDTALIGAHYDDDDGSASGSAYVFSRSNGIWTMQEKLTASDAAAYDNFGHQVSISGNTALIGAYKNDDGGNSSGSVYIYTPDGDTWTQQAKLTASDAAANDYFGYSVSISGDTAIIGAYQDDDAGNDSGSAYIYTRSNGLWTEQAKLTASDAAAGDYFGYRVSISGDFAIVGAYGSDDATYDNGSAYIYTRSNGLWTELVKHTASDATDGDYFGFSVGISGDMAIIGAYGDDIENTSTGSAYIFDLGAPLITVRFNLDKKGQRTGGGELRQQVALYDSAIAPTVKAYSGWHFSGWDVDFSLITDEITITATYIRAYTVTFVLGEYGEADENDLTQKVPEGSSANAPLVSVKYGWAFSGWDTDFDQITQNTTITATYIERTLEDYFEQKIYAGDPTHGANFGSSVCIDGNTVVVGAYGDDHAGYNSGSAYIYKQIGGVWVEEAKLTTSDAAEADYFGRSVSISGDTVIIGAHRQGDRGCAYLYIRSDGVWTEQAKLTSSDGEFGDIFGISVSIDGDTAVVGSTESAYIYTRSENVWTEQAKLEASDASAGDSFGISVSISGDSVVVGANNDDDTGSAYVYTRVGDVWTEQAKLNASNAVVNDYFGSAVSISGDSIIVGAYADDDSGTWSGSAYIFIQVNGNWSEQTKLTASDADALDEFGSSVSISGDTAVVGAASNDDAGESSGSAYVFSRIDGVWHQKELLTASDAFPRDYFGSSVSISNNTVIVGAESEEGEHTWINNVGSAYIYDLSTPKVAVVFKLNGKGQRTGGGELNQLVYPGNGATSPILSSNSGWVFDGWDSNIYYITADSTINALFSYDTTDADGDLIPDGWEIVHLGQINTSDGVVDSDGDGKSDYDEYLSGNNPADRNDYFKIIEEEFDAQDRRITLSFNSNDDLANRRYRVLYSPDMSPGSWIEVPGSVTSPSSGGETQVTVSLPGDENLFFVRIEAFIE